MAMVIILQVFSYLLVLITFLPLIKDNYWLFRTLEYPRFQKFILVLALLAAWSIIYIVEQQVDLMCIGALFVSGIYLAIKIFPYSALAKKEVLTVPDTGKNNSLKIFTANVYQYNREYERLLAQIRSCDPDLVFLVETDKAWANAVAGLKGDYPHSLLQPLENTYGLVLYSKFKLSEAEVKYLVKSDIPSVDMKLHLLSGQVVQIFGLHPEPPVPGESLRSTAKDKELMKVAFKAKDCSLPCIVLGDLNDVAWSYTTSLFTKVSKLLDLRRGRGFYSTFSAKSKFMRFPLDYIFCSEDFGMVKMQRLPFNGSDHFPIFTELSFRPDLKRTQKKKDKADQSDLQTAASMASKPVSS